jgi:hypothetical protein
MRPEAAKGLGVNAEALCFAVLVSPAKTIFPFQLGPFEKTAVLFVRAS